MKRIRLSLREMLLIVALFAVVFASLGALKNLRDVEAQGDLERLRIARKLFQERLENPQRGFYFDPRHTVEELAEIDAEIAKRQMQLD